MTTETIAPPRSKHSRDDDNYQSDSDKNPYDPGESLEGVELCAIYYVVSEVAAIVSSSEYLRYCRCTSCPEQPCQDEEDQMRRDARQH